MSESGSERLTFRTIADVTGREWLDMLGLDEAEIPDAVIVEGSWWRAERQAWRLGQLTEVRELGIPDVFWGRNGQTKIAFAMAYGAPRANEVVHIFTSLGAGIAIQIGTCGGLQPHLRPGDIVIPETADTEDGVAEHVRVRPEAAAAPIAAEPRLVALAYDLLVEFDSIDRAVEVGPHVTFSSLFAETAPMMRRWHQQGLLSVDMETATTLATAERYGAAGVSLLVVWDELTRGRRFSDPMTDAELAALDRGNDDVYRVALDLCEPNQANAIAPPTM